MGILAMAKWPNLPESMANLPIQMFYSTREADVKDCYQKCMS